MQTSAQAYKINITKPVYCEVLTDTDAGTTYGTVKTLGEAQTADITPSVSSGQLYGNGAVVDSSSRLTGIALSLKLTKIPVEALADIFNYTVTSGVLQEKAGQTAKYIAVGFEIEQTNGKSEYVWLLKGRPAPINSSVNQSEANITYSTDTLTVNFVKRKSDDMLRYFADLANPDFVQSQADKWFSQGPSSIPTPTANQG